jgi:hypothetical protein
MLTFLTLYPLVVFPGALSSLLSPLSSLLSPLSLFPSLSISPLFPSTLCPLPSTLCPLPSAFCPLPRRPIAGQGMIGAMDMGGSSTQLIMFNGTLGVAAVEESQFWSHSWLRYGAEIVRERVLQRVLEVNSNSSSSSAGDVVQIANPCALVGHFEVIDADNSMVGTGDGRACIAQIEHVLWADTIDLRHDGELLVEEVGLDGVATLPGEPLRS